MNKLIIALLLLISSIAIIWGWQSQRAKQEAELQLGLDSSRILEEQFRKARQIKVASIDGSIVARSTDSGFLGILKSSQTKKLPFTVDYYIDLSSMDSSDFYWDKQSKTMIIEAPDVVVGPPNIDETQADTKFSGIFISRKAGLRLNAAASQMVRTRAEKFAHEADNIIAARKEAREALQDFAQLPLASVGIDDVKIIVKFPFDSEEKIDNWNISRSIQDIASEMQARKIQ